MFKRTMQAALFVVAVAILMVPFSCQNASSAGTREKTTAYNLYFGDLHTHTGYSDGQGTPWEAFAAAKRAGADFMATTDHVHYPYGQIMLTPELWADTLLAAKSTTSKDFVAMAGYELWLPWAGEVNVYNTVEIYDETGNPGGHGYNNGLQGSIHEALPSLYDWLAATGAIGQWNHPTYYSGPFDMGFNESPMSNFFDFAYYTAARDQGMCVLENLESAYYELSYIWALDAGWHVMPAANSDTHSANWISGSEIRTVLLAPSLSPENLYEAMRASRGYATQDENLRIYYTVNGAVMGSILSPTGTYQVSVQISDPDGAADAIKLVEIVSDHGAVVASMGFDSAKVQWTTTLTSDSADYFYVRVTTASNLSGEEGVTAWTAPVWIGELTS
jgi:hypothetical protein